MIFFIFLLLYYYFLKQGMWSGDNFIDLDSYDGLPLKKASAGDRSLYCSLICCENRIHAKKLCKHHWQIQHRRTRRLTSLKPNQRRCGVKSCCKRVSSLGLCEKHNRRIRRNRHKEGKFCILCPSDKPGVVYTDNMCNKHYKSCQKDKGNKKKKVETITCSQSEFDWLNKEEPVKIPVLLQKYYVKKDYWS